MLLTAAIISSPSRYEVPVLTTTMPRGPTMKATFAVRPPFAGVISPPLPNSAYTPAATKTIFGCTARTPWVAHAAARTAITVLHTRGLTAMRPRSVIFVLLQLSLPFVDAARLIWNAGGEQRNVV